MTTRIPRGSVYHTDQLPTSLSHQKSISVPHDWRTIIRSYAESTKRGDLFDKRKQLFEPPAIQLFHTNDLESSASEDGAGAGTRSRAESQTGSGSKSYGSPKLSPMAVPSTISEATTIGSEGEISGNDEYDASVPEESEIQRGGWQEYRNTNTGRLIYYNEQDQKISKLPTGAEGLLVDSDPRAQRALLEYTASKNGNNEDEKRMPGGRQTSLDVLVDALSIIKTKTNAMLSAAEQSMSNKITMCVKQLQKDCKDLETLLMEEDSAETNDVDYIMGWKRSDWNFDNDRVELYRASMAPTLDMLLAIQYRDWHCPKNYSNQPLPPTASGSFDADILLPDGCVKTKTKRRISPDTTCKRVIHDLYNIRAISRSLEALGRPDEFCLKAVGFNDYITGNDILFNTEYVRERLRYRRPVQVVMIKVPKKTQADLEKEKEAEAYVEQYKSKINSDIVKQFVDWSDLEIPEDILAKPGNLPRTRTPYLSVSGRISTGGRVSAAPLPQRSPTVNLGTRPIGAYGWRTLNQWPLQDCSLPFSITVMGAQECNKRSLPRLENSLNSRIGINLFLFLGAKRILLKDSYTRFIPTCENPRWLEKVPSTEVTQQSLGMMNTILYRHIPRGARLGVMLWESGRYKTGKKAEGHKVVLGWTVIQLVDELGKFVQGDVDVRLWKMEKKDKYVATAGLEAVVDSPPEKESKAARAAAAAQNREKEIDMFSEWMYRESNRDNRFKSQAACQIRLRFPTFPVPIVAPLIQPYVTPSPAQEKKDVDWRSMDYQEQLQIKDIIKYDALEDIGPVKDLVWRCRTSLAREPGMLYKVLQCADWSDPVDVHEAHRLILRWAPPHQPNLALQFLDFRFADPLVREYAVNHLKRLEDAELRMYLLQLVQCLKYEAYHDSPLSRFLIMRALRNPMMIGHFLFWHLQAEMSFAPTFKERYQVILELYLSMAGRHTYELRKQLACVRKLEVISDLIMRLRRGEDAGGLKDVDYEYKERLVELNQDFFRRIGSIHNPLNPRIEMTTLRIDKCKYMSSKMVPLWLVFNNKDPYAGKVSPSMEKIYLIFKTGDDLRQDALTLQILQLMDRMWLKNKLDMRLSPYQTVATGFNRRGTPAGLIEVVLNSSTTESIQVEHGGALNPMCIDNYLRKNNPDGNELSIAKENFSRSCAGYCVATYTLGIGDRHSGNIMCKKDGHLFHIDFGHFLGNFKSKFGIKRERTAFVFTPEMAYVMSGKKGTSSHGYKAFVDLAKDAFWVVRGNAVLWETLFLLMVSAGMPECLMASDIDYMRKQMLLEKTPKEAGRDFEKEITKARKDTYRRIDNFIHNFKHN
ncbi:hypothetical protein AAMO2058_000328200 [Amorphochlora amoebiformis]